MVYVPGTFAMTAKMLEVMLQPTLVEFGGVFGRAANFAASIETRWAA